MRPTRPRALALAAAPLLVLAAPVVRAAPLPLHEAQAQFAVPAGITAVVVDVDRGAVSVRAGTGPGTAHTQWDVWQPTFTRTVTGHTLRLVGRCAADHSPLAPVQVVGSDPDCAVDLTLPVPAATTLTVQGTAVSVSGLGGRLDLTAVRDVSVDRAGPGAVRARSVTAGARVTATRAQAVVVEATRAAALASVTAGDLSAVSDASSVSLTDVRVSGRLTATASDDLQAERVRAPHAALTSQAGAVSLLRSRLDDLAATASGAVAVDGLVASSARLRSEAATVRVLRSTVRELAATASDSVAATLLTVPSRVQLTSEAAWVSLVVPRARYAVSTRTDSGRVTVEGVVVDPRAPRSIDVRASTDISIT